MNRAVGLALAAALAAPFAACKSGPAVRPTERRELPDPDLAGCLQQVSQIQPDLVQKSEPGELRISMLVDADGAVPVAFIRNQKRVDSPQLFNCFTSGAVQDKFDGEGVDYLRTAQVECSKADCRKVRKAAPGNGELDEKLAESTLAFADFANETDKGWGYYYVHKYDDAIKAFDAAVKADPKNVRAQRGLATALAESHGDLNRALEAAKKAVELAPKNPAAYEAMVHVCLAKKDDVCVAENFESAVKVKDAGNEGLKMVQARSLELAELQPQAVEAAKRATNESHQQHEAAVAEGQKQAAEADPTGCAKVTDKGEQAVCFVKHCLEAGAGKHAKKMSHLTGQNFSVKSWSAKEQGSGYLVVAHIRDASGAKHDAEWDTSVGETVTFKPLNLDAKIISKDYNACHK